MLKNWKPPKDWKAIQTIDAHAAGEPLRIITQGIEKIPGDTILEKRRYAQKNLDYLRRGLIWEPRGHADMYGAILTEPVTPDGDLGVLFLHNEGFSTMCGHGIIALTTVVLDKGKNVKDPPDPVLRIDTPAGRIIATAHREKGRVKSVSFLNVPSFVYKKGQVVQVEGIGPIRYDVAFGGAFYAFCSAEELEVGLQPKDFHRLIDYGKRIKSAVMKSLPIEHPFEKELGFLYGTIFIGKPAVPEHHSRNVCIFAEGEVDRSPTGTGVSARAAIHYERGELALEKQIVVESILGTCFSVRATKTLKFGPYEAVIPEVTGDAFIVGQNTFLFDPEDPLRNGFILR
ncbi:MAG: proline racemase family protein [Candidatus Aminicenantes bacterium]|nr:MAG: proline racemase family protein [Candidatus Aminicenantes bacterium]